MSKGELMNRYLVNARFSFLYVVIFSIAIGCASTYSLIAGLGRWQTMLLLAGALIGAWATLFAFLEIRRVAKTPNYKTDEALLQEPNPYAPRTVTVGSSTGEPYPHHEDYPESAGLEEGQLTARLNDPTPFIEEFLNRRKQKIAG